MRLLTRTGLYYFAVAVPVLAGASYVCFRMVSKEIRDNTDENLWKEKGQAEKFILKNDTIRHYYFGANDQNEILHVRDYHYQTAYSDTILYDKDEEERLPFRMLKSYFTTGKNNYLITLRKNTIESDDLVSAIIFPILILFGLLLIGFLLINWWVARKIWKPFNNTLEVLSSYSPSLSEPLRFEKAPVKEFTRLNLALSKMTEKIHADFLSQKQFAENASHEMQTPLAVIQSKIELLIQSKTLSGADMQIIQSVYDSARKLSQLNKALVLLSKIGNNQFTETALVNLESLIVNLLFNYDDRIAQQGIRLKRNILFKEKIEMNSALAEVLFDNLIRNAVIHNYQNGAIEIMLAQHEFTISNTGAPLTVKPEDLFERFRKNDQSSASLGLGLSIVKQICDVSGIHVDYSYSDNLHTVRLSF